MAVAGAFIVPHPPIILPEIGRGEEAKIQKTAEAYWEIAGEAAGLHPETVVILSPHSVLYRDYFHISPGAGARGDFGQFRAPGVKVSAEYDMDLVQELCRVARAAGLPAGIYGELDPVLDHGTMIPPRFLQKRCDKFRIVRIGLSGLPFALHYQLGQCIARAAQNLDRRIVVIASGDLSHKLLESGPYGFAPEGPEYDEAVTSVMASGDLKKLLDFDEKFCEKAAECGHRSFTVMAGCLDKMPLKSRLLSHEGPFGVGYAVASFQDACVALARQSMEHWVKTKRLLALPEELPQALLDHRAGVFVSLHEHGCLRGCIGTVLGVHKNVAEEILENAVSACARDPRFRPVEEWELADIICTVDELSKPEPIESEECLDVKRYGVIVSKGRRRGLLLPNLEGVENVRQQVELAKQKAGIYGDEYDLERFEVVRHY